MSNDTLTWRVTPDLLGILDASGHFKEVNPAWERTLGWTAQDIVSRPFFEFLHPDDIGFSEKAFAEIKTGTPILDFKNRYRHRDGTYRWLWWNAVPEGDVFFCSARDITDAKLNEGRLHTREREAQFREQFIAVLGHDLRNPVAAINAALRMVGKEEQSRKSLEVLNLAQNSVHRISHLIDDMMDFARTRLGDGIEFDLRETQLREVIEQTAREIGIAHPGVAIELDLTFHDPVRCDGDRTAQLVSNLLGNAVTHGRENRPISVTGREVDGAVEIAVTNEGEPIPDAVLPLLFHPFARHDVRESLNGLGLGLFIAQEIAKGHKGELIVASDAARTVFTFRLPRG